MGFLSNSSSRRWVGMPAISFGNNKKKEEDSANHNYLIIDDSDRTMNTTRNYSRSGSEVDCHINSDIVIATLIVQPVADSCHPNRILRNDSSPRGKMMTKPMPPPKAKAKEVSTAVATTATSATPAPVTPATDSLGRCLEHPFIQLRRFSNSTSEWKSLLDSCPLCAATSDDDDDGDVNNNESTIRDSNVAMPASARRRRHQNPKPMQLPPPPSKPRLSRSKNSPPRVPSRRSRSNLKTRMEGPHYEPRQRSTATRAPQQGSSSNSNTEMQERQRQSRRGERFLKGHTYCTAPWMAERPRREGFRSADGLGCSATTIVASNVAARTNREVEDRAKTVRFSRTVGRPGCFLPPVFSTRDENSFA